ncbi:hypothetical protein Poly24_22990 [Rosistilla carotiformis]|uniref:Uncharacterized protein n=1 Tax=Rosistilla carotiformis TaxID=2528017 RepID=A0A518JSS2_9BACT|nr:hypothetical protein [Rosistilla carotiformis]QDV68589.1 hypothetical protein Poly24_22990 [Rosistilla carotiformis]
MKGKMDGDALKKFAINHVEKLVLGLVVAVFGLLIYKGLSIEPFAEAKNPENLTSTANQVMTELETTHWEAIESEEPRVATVKYEKNVELSRDSIDAGLQFKEKGFPKSRSKIKRRDPEIDAPEYAPQEIQLVAVLGAFSLNPPAGTPDPFEALEDAPKMEVEEEKKPVRRRPRRQPRGGEAGMMMEGMMGGEMMMPEMGAGEMEMGMGMGMGMGGASMARKLDPKYDRGYRGAGMGMGMGEMGGGMGGPRGNATQRPIAYTHQFIAGTAVMPNELLNEAFQDALGDATGFDPRRDRPKYIAFRVIRADVTDRDVSELEEPDDAKILAEEGDWVVTTSNNFMNSMYIKHWAGFSPEVISPEYMDSVLTMPIPPLLIQDYMKFAVHSLVPLAGHKKRDNNAAVEKTPVDAPDVTGPAVGTRLDLGALQNRGPASRTGIPGMMGAEGMMGPEGMMGSEMMMGSEGMMGSEMMMGSEGMMGMMGPDGMMGSTVVVASEYKLIRFYDFRDSPRRNKFGPQPGRKYVYRIQVAIEDPNYPINGRFAPPLKTLDPDVLERIQKRTMLDAEITKKEGSTYRTGYLWSAWSKPSPPASLPELSWFAGGLTHPEVMTSQEGKSFQKNPPTADIVAVNWDWGFATERTAQFESATRGSILDNPSFTDEIVNPSTLEIKQLDNASVKSRGVLVDIAGGENLAALDAEEEPMLAPGKMLLFDENGGLVVQHEIEDAFRFRRYTFADERERLQKAKAASTMPEPGMGEGAMPEFSFGGE